MKWLLIWFVTEKRNQIITELFIRSGKLKISAVFITRFYATVPKDARLNFTQFFIMKSLEKQELQQIAFNHSSDIDFKHFMNLYEQCTAKPYAFLVNVTTFESANPLHFRRT